MHLNKAWLFTKRHHIVSKDFLAFDILSFCVVIRFFHPRHNGQWPQTSKDFLSQILSITFYISYLNSWERASIFPFECSVLNKGTTGTIFITSLVWRCPWLGIEPRTSRTQIQYSTTRLSRRRCNNIDPCFVSKGLNYSTTNEPFFGWICGYNIPVQKVLVVDVHLNLIFIHTWFNFIGLPGESVPGYSSIFSSLEYQHKLK